MNKIKQQIAIAEACPAIFEINNGRYKLPFFIRYRASGHECDPLNDLNSMHAAEFARIIGNDEHEFNYRCALDKIMGHDRSLIHFATAAQRAEAFLRTIGKWEDE